MYFKKYLHNNSNTKDDETLPNLSKENIQAREKKRNKRQGPNV